MEGAVALDDYRIPIVFYKPDGSLKGSNSKIANQIDIVPSILHLLNYPYPFYSQGKDLFSDDCNNFAVNYNSGVYQYIDSTYCFQMDSQKRIAFYNWKADKGFLKNLNAPVYSKIVENRESKLKKFLQVFTTNMITNKMIVEPSTK
jgi:phosphoglycerol transferase MdoB-like AlkP superfamily enzyme